MTTTKKERKKDKRGNFRQKVYGKDLYAKTPEELEMKVERRKALYSTYGKDYDITLGKYILNWYKAKKDEVETNTYDVYGYWAKEIIDRIGKIKMIDCTPAVLENCVKDFAKTKCKQTNDYPSQRYINGLVTVLKLVFKQAKKEMLVNTNYAEDIKVKSKKKVVKRGHRALSPEEVNLILNYDHPMRPYYLFMLLCGLMPEEVVPLTWGDVILEDKQYYISINKTAQLLNKTTVRPNTAKNEYRIRTVPIPYPLDKWVKSEKKEHKGKELMFTNRDGAILTKSGLRKRWESYLEDLDIYYNKKKNKFDPTKTEKDKKLTIERFTPYDLRHTYATLLAEIDTPVRKTTALMGHSTSATTDRYYIDFSKFDTSSVMNTFGEKIKTIENLDKKKTNRAAV